MADGSRRGGESKKQIGAERIKKSGSSVKEDPEGIGSGQGGRRY